MKKNLLLLILFGSLTVSCNSELTTVTPGFEGTIADTKVDISSQKDGGQKDTAIQQDTSTIDASDASADVENDQNDTGSTIKGSAGCGVGEGIPEGENTFMLEGRMRNYVMRLPDGYTNERPWPVVLALHGNGGTSGYWDAETGDRNIRGVLKDDAILIIANAIDKQWRDYSMPTETRPARIESELLYFEEVLSQAKNKLCVKEESIFAMGFSGGGSFSGVLGCRRPDIRAIAVGGSVIYFDEAKCISTPAAWITIGTQELQPGREAYRDFFRDRAGCEATTMATAPDPCVAYDGCDAGTPVHYCQHPAGHVWPALGTPAMWDFFKRFL